VALLLKSVELFGQILRAAGAPLRVERDEPAFLGNTFRILLLRKEAAS
jgi:hypothetical protein